MDFCFALIRFGTCEAHWSPELYWKIPLQAANSIRIDKTLFLSSYLPGLGATGPAGNGGGGVRCVVVYPRRGGWHGTLGRNKSRQAIILESCGDSWSFLTDVIPVWSERYFPTQALFQEPNPKAAALTEADFLQLFCLETVHSVLPGLLQEARGQPQPSVIH